MPEKYVRSIKITFLDCVLPLTILSSSDWTQSIDLNLVDNVLLNASRIGHGFAALRHPLVMEAVKQKGIAIELNPISNQVSGLFIE